jgi:hypothetical protein
MRLALTSVGALFLLSSLSACTATGSSTTIAGSSGMPGFEETSDGGTTTEQPAGPADYEAMFGPPASTETTPNKLAGLWAGTVDGLDVRFRVASNSIIIAKRCSGKAVGLTVSAIVSSSSIKIVESKATEPSGYGCAIDVRPGSLGVCPTGVDEYGQPLPAKNCFSLDGTDLKIDAAFLKGTTSSSYTGKPLDVLTKLSD